MKRQGCAFNHDPNKVKHTPDRLLGQSQTAATQQERSFFLVVYMGKGLTIFIVQRKDSMSTHQVSLPHLCL